MFSHEFWVDRVFKRPLVACINKEIWLYLSFNCIKWDLCKVVDYVLGHLCECVTCMIFVVERM